MSSAEPVALRGIDPRRVELVLRRCEADRRRADPGPAAAEPTGEVPLSLGQERLWLAEQLSPGNVSYNVSVPLRLRGVVDVAALSGALDRIVTRHEALRTTVVLRGGLPRGQVRSPQTGLLRVLDLAGLRPEEQDSAVARRIDEHARRPFDLAAGPLVRPELLRLGGSDAVLVLTVHHIAADNFSMRVLCRELAVFYADPAADLPPPLPYSVFAERQRTALTAELDRQRRYWLDQLAGSPAGLDLPLDRARPAEQSFRGARAGFRLPATVVPAFRSLLQRHDVTTFMVMLAGFAVVLQRHTGQDDLVVGTDVANRTGTDVEDVIGFFANQLVLRLRLEDDPTVAELLRRVRTVCLSAYEHQDLPFQQLVSLLGLARARDRPPVFQVKLGFLQFSADELRLPGCTVTPMPTGGTAKFDLELVCWSEPDGRIGGFVEYATDLFDAATVRRLADHLTDAVTAMTADDTVTALHLPLRGGGRVGSATAPPATFDFE